ncbi:protein-disulfide reductase DsbD domain-containing protein, partial [Zunongwangia pacifica]
MLKTGRLFQASLLLFLLFTVTGGAQILNPVKWSTTTEKISDTEYYLVAKAILEDGWHLYSQNVPDGGPVATTFIYDDSEGNFRIVGNTQEEDGIVVEDPVFEMEIKYFAKSVIFKQKIELTGEVKTIQAFVEFMVCDNTRCLPPGEEELIFNLLEQTSAETVTGSTKSANDLSQEKEPESSRDLFTIFILSFLGGFAALLTPCVFP